jgi:signal transduction histidine kinase
MHLYRIAQEAINNATKHGKARNILVSLIQDDKATTLRIVDDGVGISHAPRGNGGLGLGLMEYRARLTGGEFQIEEPPSGGTIILCTIPLQDESWRQHAA